ncbi:MAG: hypothetical protein ABDH37_04390 [Candidatus Hydrothermales bacterium]
MILFFILFQLKDIDLFTETSRRESWGIYKLKRVEELLKNNFVHAKQDLLDILDSNLSDSIKGIACEKLMFLPPDSFQNSLLALNYLLDLTFYERRREALSVLFNYFKNKGDYRSCEKILRRISSDYPLYREESQIEIFEISLRNKNFDNIYPLISVIKRTRPDLYLLYLSEIGDTVSFLFNYDTLENLKNFFYYDSLSKIFSNYHGFFKSFREDPDSENFKIWKNFYFFKKDKFKADSLREFIYENFGFILPRFPDSSYIKEILFNLLKDKKVQWDEVYKRGLYDIIYHFAGSRNRYYLPSLYFLNFLNQEINIPEDLTGDSLFVSLLLFKKYKKGINFVPSGYEYLKGRFYFERGYIDSAIYFLRLSRYYNDIALLINLLSLKGETLAVDSLLKKYDFFNLIKYRNGREGIIHYLNLKENDEILFSFYNYLKNFDGDLLRKNYKFFTRYLEKSGRYSELFRFAIFLDDDTLKIKSLIYLNKLEFAEFYFKRNMTKSKFIVESFFNYYANLANIEGINNLKILLGENDELKDKKKWIDSVFSNYERAIKFIKEQKYHRADSILNILKDDVYLKRKVLFDIANINFVTGKLHEAKKLFRYLFETYKDEFALFNLTLVLRRLEDDSTIYFYKVYLDYSRGKPDYYYAVKRLAYIYLDKGKYEKSRELMELIYGLSPDTFEEKELKFFYMQVLKTNLDFERSMREGFMVYLNYPKDDLFTKAAFEESIEISKILKFNYKNLINLKR